MFERRFARYSITLAVMVAAAAPSISRAAETADLEFVQASISDAYTEIAEAWGLEIRFDPKFRGGERVTIEMEDVTAQEALETLARARGHAIVVEDHGGLIVFDDTPQNRREYEPLVMEMFAPEFIPAKDLDKLLRSLIEARRIAVNEQLQTVTMRDTAAKICVARKLLDIFDQPPSEIDLEVQLIQLEGEGAGAVPHRLGREALRELRSQPGASLLASFGMALVGSKDARLELPAPSGLPGTMSLRARGSNQYGTGNVTLSYQFDLTRRFVLGEQQRTDRISSASQTVSLTEDQTLVLPVKIDSPERALILAIEPRIIRPSALDPEGQRSFEVGTESSILCQDSDPLAEALKGVELVREPVPVIRPVSPVLRPGPQPGTGGGYDGRPRPYVVPVGPEREDPAAQPTPRPDEPPQ
jgi:hypothetical protein